MSTATDAPERTALYRIYGDADLLLYIGVSNDFGARWKTHAKAQPWWDEMRRLAVDEWHESRYAAERAEAAAIKAEKPKYNKTHTRPPRPPVSNACIASKRQQQEQIGVRLRDARESKGLTQAAVAAAMARRGSRWHQMTVYKLENGQRVLTAGEATVLREIFGFPSAQAFIDFLIPEENSTPSDERGAA